MEAGANEKDVDLKTSTIDIGSFSSQTGMKTCVFTIIWNYFLVASCLTIIFISIFRGCEANVSRCIVVPGIFENSVERLQCQW